MKKKLLIILLGVIFACVLVFGFLYANNDIGKTSNNLEADIRHRKKFWMIGLLMEAFPTQWLHLFLTHRTRQTTLFLSM